MEQAEASTYSTFGVMFVEWAAGTEHGHVHWSACNAAYSDAGELRAWVDKWGEGLDDKARIRFNAILAAKTAYEEKRKAVAGDNPTHTLDLGVGLEEAHKAWLDEAVKEYD